MIAGTKYASASWTPDGKGFYYTWVPPIGASVTIAERPGFAEVRFHELGTDPAKDPRGPSGDRQTRRRSSAAASRATATGCSSTIQHGWNSTDVYFKDARKDDAPWHAARDGRRRDVRRRRRGTTSFYVITNDGAPRYRVFKVDPKKPERASVEGDHPGGATRRSSSVDDRRRAPRARRTCATPRASSRSATLDGKLVRKVAAAAARHARRASSATPTRTPAYFVVHVVHRAAGDLQDVDQDAARSTSVGARRSCPSTRRRSPPSRSSTRRRTARRSRCSSCTGRTSQRDGNAPDAPLRLRRLQRRA